jgi:hypothetical protein
VGGCVASQRARISAGVCVRSRREPVEVDAARQRERQRRGAVTVSSVITSEVTQWVSRMRSMPLDDARARRIEAGLVAAELARFAHDGRLPSNPGAASRATSPSTLVLLRWWRESLLIGLSGDGYSAAWARVALGWQTAASVRTMLSGLRPS